MEVVRTSRKRGRPMTVSGFIRRTRTRGARRAPARLRRRGVGIGNELKFFDVETAVDAFAVTWETIEPATTNLTAVAQGDGESNRDGRSYVIMGINIKGFISIAVSEAQTAPVGDQLARLVLVWDKQTNGAQLTATQVMDGAQTDDINSFKNLQFTKRFVILKDQTWMVRRVGLNEGAVNAFAAGNRSLPFEWNINFRVPMEVTMSGTGADIANVTDNSIHMIGVATSTIVKASYQCRIRFRG